VIEMTGAATVVTLSPPSLTFASQTVGTRSAPQSIQLTNNGQTAVHVGAIGLVGNDPGDFKETNNCVGTIAPGANCTISITFKPFKKGSRTASVDITDDGGASPQFAGLSGTGT
jgi:archaellum component FlaF (FlaF/FlaG flagellin family)